MKNVIGPKVLEPMADWYEQRVATAPVAGGGPDPGTDTSSEDASAFGAEPASLASARAAEAFLAGADSGDRPAAPTTAPPTSTARDAPSAGEEVAFDEPAGSPEPDHPPVAAAASRFARVKHTALAVKDRIKEHNLNVVAAGVAFWALLAIPAILTAVVSIYGLVASPDDVEGQVDDALSGASPEVQQVVGDQLSAVAGASGGGLAVGAGVGILLALWTSSGAVAKVIATLNVIWGVTEDRKFLKLRGLAVALTVGAILLVGAAGFLLAVLPAVLGETDIGDAARWLLNTARFPALLLAMAVGLSILYWAGPNRKRRLRLVTWGAVTATVLWLIVSGLFSIYTASFASYNETYGSLGAVVVLLLWLFITAFMVLLGAEIDAANEDR